MIIKEVEEEDAIAFKAKLSDLDAVSKLKNEITVKVRKNFELMIL